MAATPGANPASLCRSVLFSKGETSLGRSGPLKAIFNGALQMENPFKRISDVFQPDYNVNFCIEKPDGTILLTLTDAAGVAVKRFISASQWRDQQQLEQLITSLHYCLAIERGRELPRDSIAV